MVLNCYRDVRRVPILQSAEVSDSKVPNVTKDVTIEVKKGKQRLVGNKLFRIFF